MEPDWQQSFWGANYPRLQTYGVSPALCTTVAAPCVTRIPHPAHPEYRCWVRVASTSVPKRVYVMVETYRHLRLVPLWLPTLWRRLKTAYDPNNVFNCYHCVENA